MIRSRLIKRLLSTTAIAAWLTTGSAQAQSDNSLPSLAGEEILLQMKESSLRDEIDRRRKVEEAAERRAQQQKEAIQRAKTRQFGKCYFDWKGWKKHSADIRYTAFDCYGLQAPADWKEVINLIGVNCRTLKTSKSNTITHDRFGFSSDWKYPDGDKAAIVAALCSSI